MGTLSMIREHCHVDNSEEELLKSPGAPILLLRKKESALSKMIAAVNVPVYALGGVSKNDTEKAWLAGAQGIAAIGALWDPA